MDRVDTMDSSEMLRLLEVSGIIQPRSLNSFATCPSIFIMILVNSGFLVLSPQAAVCTVYKA